jgi:hypothetical protein
LAARSAASETEGIAESIGADVEVVDGVGIGACKQTLADLTMASIDEPAGLMLRMSI